MYVHAHTYHDFLMTLRIMDPFQGPWAEQAWVARSKR